MSDSLNERRAARHNMMVNERMSKVLPALAIPMIVSMIIDSIYNLADTFFVSGLGTAATAAVGVNDSLMHIIMAISSGFGMGASSYISRLLGAKDEKLASKVGATSLYSVMLLAAAFAVFGYVFMDELVLMLGATLESKPYTIEYASFILLAAPITCANMVLSQLLRAEGSATFSMVGRVSGCFINIILDPIFINVFKWGVTGAAAATALSKLISFCILLIPFITKRSIISLSFKLFTPKWFIYKEVAKMGLPSFLRASLMSLTTVLINRIAGGYGDYALASISVGNKCMMFVASAVMGFGMGFQPIAGYCWGAKRYHRIFEAFNFSVKVGLVSGLVLGGGLFIFAPNVIGLFNSSNDPRIIELGSLMIRAQCLTLIAHMWVMLVGGIYQALGKAIGATVLNLSRQIICLLPSVLIMSTLFGVKGLAVSQGVSDVFTLAFGIPMYILIRKSINKTAREYELAKAKDPSLDVERAEKLAEDAELAAEADINTESI